MRVVSKRTEAEMAAARAEADVLYSLKVLTGELMRVVRGAGKPHELEKLAGSFFASSQRYREVSGSGLSTDKIAYALGVRADLTEHDSFAFQRGACIEQVISGALQVAASRLLQDHLRESNGEDEVYSGMQNWMKFREDARKEAGREKRQARAALVKNGSDKSRGQKRK